MLCHCQSIRVSVLGTPGNGTVQHPQGVEMRDHKVANEWQATKLQVEGS